ncbi:lanthionine synthetase LanC family protein [Amycolatopsis sp. cmx-11-51]|uniref:lanthionine synthetase LanC family protein n=1 Tax=unclassified Amycolatopsis TaxID=2618356 RepID=UPI0039E48DE6
MVTELNAACVRVARAHTFGKGMGIAAPQIGEIVAVRGTLDIPGDRPRREREHLRPSWCYGTPGIARALQLAGRALHDRFRQQRAEAAFTTCLNDPAQLDSLTDRSLCHGTGGLLATARRIAADAVEPITLTSALQRHRDATAPPDEPAGFLTGSAEPPSRPSQPWRHRGTPAFCSADPQRPLWARPHGNN